MKKFLILSLSALLLAGPPRAGASDMLTECIKEVLQERLEKTMGDFTDKDYWQDLLTNTAAGTPEVVVQQIIDDYDPKSAAKDVGMKILERLVPEAASALGILLVANDAVYAYTDYMLQFYKDDFDLAIVMTETPVNGFWQPIVGNKWVHQFWNPFIVTKLLEEQVKMKKKEQDEPGFRGRRVLLILDDIIGDRNRIHEDQMINRLAVQGRHYNISVALTTQDPKAIHPVLRNNCDVAVIFQQKNQRAKESVFNDFLNVFPRKEVAVELMKTYTHDHGCIVVENHKLNEIPERLYWHVPGEMTFDQATQRCKCPEYQLGCEEQKALAKSPHGQKPLFSGDVVR